MAVDRPTPQSTPVDLSLEYRALKRCIRPMPHDTDGRVVAKIIAVMLVTTWLGITVAVSFGAAVVPPHWLPFTALIFLLVGRLWDLEVQQLLPGAYGSDESTNSDQTDGGDDS